MASSLEETIEASTRGGISLLFGNVAANLILAVGLLIIPRLLGSDQYGLYSISFVLPSLLILFVDLGINAGLIRYGAYFISKGEEGKAAELLKTGLLFETIISMVVFAISFTFADYFAANLLNRPSAGYYIRIASLAIPSQILFATASSIFVGIGKMKNVAIISTLQAFTKVSVSIALVLLTFGTLGALIGYIASYLITGITGVLLILMVYYKHLKKSHQGQTSFKDITKALIKYGFPLYISAMAGGFVSQYQGVVLPWFVSNAEVGNLRATTNLLTILVMVTGSIGTTLFPAFSRLDPNGEEIKKFYRIAVKYTTLLIIPAAVLLLVLSKEVVRIAYGSTYSSAPLYLSVYCASYLLVGLGSLVQSNFFNGTGNTWITLKTLLVTLALVVPFTPILASIYGVLGLIVAHIASNMIGTLYGFSLVRSRFRIRLFSQTLLRIYIISVVAALPVLVLLAISPLWWLFNAIISAAIYLFILLTLIPLSGILQASELQKIEALLRRIAILEKMLKPITSYEGKLINRKTPVANKPET